MITTFLSLITAGLLVQTPPLSSEVGSYYNQTSNPVIFEASILPANRIPIKNDQFIEPLIKAKAALSIDLETGMILYQKNPDQKLPIASLTKLMTAIVIIEENKLTEIVSIPKEATKIEGSKAWLAQGEKISISKLIKALLITSANDAAVSLALHNSNSIEKFVDKMNAKAKLLGMYNTHFKNPVGLDEDDHYSTAYDLSLLARYAINKEVIKTTVTEKEADISSEDGKFKHKLLTTNELLSSYLKVLGLKTGTTDEAGQCLISIVKNEQGDKIVNILLNSPERFQEAKILSEWSFKAYNWN